MSIFKAVFGLCKIPQVVKFFEFKSFDDVNKMGGAIAQIKQQVREGGLQLTQAQQKFLDDQMKQVEMVFEKIQQLKKETGIKSTQSAKIFDLQGQEIPQGSKIMGGKAIKETEAEIAERLGRENKQAVGNIRKKKLRDEISKLDDKIEARKLQLEQRGVEDFETDSLFNKLDEQRNDLELKLDFEDMVDPEDFAQGGRAGMLSGGLLSKGIMGALEQIKNMDEGNLFSKLDPLGKAKTIRDALIDRIKGFKNIIKDLKKEGRPIDEIEDFKFELDEAKDSLEKINEYIKNQPTNRTLQAQGGRAGFKDGMSRRKFMQIMGGLAAIPIVGKFFKLGKVATKAAPIVKTPPVPGKPEWFDALVNKVIAEGEDVTKQFGYKERMKVYTKPISETEEVTVYRDLDDNSVRVNYGKKLKIDDTKPYERGNIGRAINDPDQIDLIVREGENIEPDLKTGKGGGKTKASFEASEAEPRAVGGPEDADIEFDAIREVDNVDDLMQDVSSLEEFATGKKLTGDKAAKAKKKREDFQRFTEDPVEQAEYLENKYGPYDDSAMDDFASGGIARMLGE